MISFIKDLRRPSVGAVWTMLSIDQLDGHAVCAVGLRLSVVSARLTAIIDSGAAP